MRFKSPKWYEVRFCAEISKLKAESKTLTDETGVVHHCDHIVPLNSPLVHGFNVSWNLQVMPGFLNSIKSNRWWPTMTTSEVIEAIAFYKARGDIK